MTLDVRLIHDVQTEFIAQVEQHRIVGIVRRSNCVDVVLLHRDEFFTDLSGQERFAGVRMMVMPIHTADHDRLAVDRKDAISDADVAKTGPHDDRLDVTYSAGTDKWWLVYQVASVMLDGEPMRVEDARARIPLARNGGSYAVTVRL